MVESLHKSNLKSRSSLKSKRPHNPLCVLPNQWRGQSNCLIGPFSSREVALYFAQHVMTKHPARVRMQRIFARRSDWYIEAR